MSVVQLIDRYREQELLYPGLRCTQHTDCSPHCAEP